MQRSPMEAYLEYQTSVIKVLEAQIKAMHDAEVARRRADAHNLCKAQDKVDLIIRLLKRQGPAGASLLKAMQS